jgi:hypothetical protein
LLIANCDEFIYYDDLVRRREAPARARPVRRSSAPANKEASVDPKRQEALDLVVSTFDALMEERGEDEKIWGSMIKQTLKRRQPGFSESYYGYKSFGQLLEELQSAGIFRLELDEKSGGYIVRRARES